ncbi:MAG: hypothetical protein IKL81_04335 [Clostridia bacterium]|nr:hypothetical protein [Clostridia bacterium]
MDISLLCEQNFLTENESRPLKIIRAFPYDRFDTIAKKQQIIRDSLISLQAQGFGGIATNVSPCDHLENAEEWQILRYTLQLCNEMGLRVCIYDDEANDSGSATAQMLCKHPEWRPQAISLISKTAMPGEKIEIDLPESYTDIIAAYAYSASSVDGISRDNIENPTKVYRIANARSLYDVNDTSLPLTAVVFARKYYADCVSERSFIDLSNHDAVSHFIDSSYRRYVTNAEGCTDIEAFLSAGPAYRGVMSDESASNLPKINWFADIENRFSSKFGYDITKKLIYLFAIDSREARQTRLDFYEMSSEIFEESFFSQISDFCAKAKIPFSGSLKYDDNILYHPIFEGNYFSLLRHMHAPGIKVDILPPEKIRSKAFSAKLVSSIAHTYNRPHVMGEISYPMDEAISAEQLSCSLASQYALGVDRLMSEISIDSISNEKYRNCNDAIARIDSIMGGGKHVSNIAVYYPIETMQANYIPASGSAIDTAYANESTATAWSSLRAAYNNLICNQLDFDLLDMYAIERASIHSSAINTTGGESFRVLIIPACYVSDEMEVVVRHLGYKGVTVIALHDEQFASDAARLRECGAITVYNPGQLASTIRGAIREPITLNDYCPSVLSLCRESENGRSYLLVNTSDNAISTTACLCDMPENVTLYNPLCDRVIGEYPSGKVDIEIEPYGFVVIM